jgi:hypothetical protein
MWNIWVQAAEVSQRRTAVSSKCFQLYYTCSDRLLAIALPPYSFHLFPLLLWRFLSSQLFCVHYKVCVSAQRTCDDDQLSVITSLCHAQRSFLEDHMSWGPGCRNAFSALVSAQWPTAILTRHTLQNNKFDLVHWQLEAAKAHGFAYREQPPLQLCADVCPFETFLSFSTQVG